MYKSIFSYSFLCLLFLCSCSTYNINVKVSRRINNLSKNKTICLIPNNLEKNEFDEYKMLFNEILSEYGYLVLDEDCPYEMIFEVANDSKTTQTIDPFYNYTDNNYFNHSNNTIVYFMKNLKIKIIHNNNNVFIAEANAVSADPDIYNNKRCIIDAILMKIDDQYKEKYSYSCKVKRF